MTTYSAITAGESDSDSPVTDTLVGKLRDNPIAIAEGSTGAPFLSSSWHNYDGAQALTAIYDFAAHGSVATVVSPDFADGWEYQFLFDDVTTSAGGSTDDLRIELYRETGAAYSGSSVILTDASNAVARGIVTILAPRRVVKIHALEQWLQDGTAANSNSAETNTSLATMSMERMAVSFATAQKILRARFAWATGNINGGKIYMARRQVGDTR